MRARLGRDLFAHPPRSPQGAAEAGKKRERQKESIEASNRECYSVHTPVSSSQRTKEAAFESILRASFLEPGDPGACRSGVCSQMSFISLSLMLFSEKPSILRAGVVSHVCSHEKGTGETETEPRFGGAAMQLGAADPPSSAPEREPRSLHWSHTRRNQGASTFAAFRHLVERRPLREVCAADARGQRGSGESL